MLFKEPYYLDAPLDKVTNIDAKIPVDRVGNLDFKQQLGRDDTVGKGHYITDQKGFKTSYITNHDALQKKY